MVFHYHDRPGGVRQVIARGLPALVERLGDVQEVALLLGELTDPGWVRLLEQSLGGVPLRIIVHREFGYSGEASRDLAKEAVRLLGGILSGVGTLCWAHNLSVGRNLPLLRHLPGACADAGARLWLHHHDWWWDGRWARWRDWQAAGVAGLEEALALSSPVGPHIRHWCVNRADLPWLKIRVGRAAQWVGNPLPDLMPPAARETAAARAWLDEIAQGRRVWLAPVRALRRKNLAEAIFLAQHHAEPVCVVTTGGPSSAAEVPTWSELCQAAVRHRWPFVPAVLAREARASGRWHPFRSAAGPSLPSLFAAADAVVMPSLQEGFGLPYLEAAALGKPLLARALPEVSANLSALGCSVPDSYENLLVPSGSFDAARERIRVRDRWNTLRSTLPMELAPDMASGPLPEAMDFAELTLEAQLEVLESGTGPAGGLPVPHLPRWPEGNRKDGWVERFFEDPPEEGQYSAGRLHGTDGPSGAELLREVTRRFQWWRHHPLLWP